MMRCDEVLDLPLGWIPWIAHTAAARGLPVVVWTRLDGWCSGSWIVPSDADRLTIGQRVCCGSLRTYLSIWRDGRILGEVRLESEASTSPVLEGRWQALLLEAIALESRGSAPQDAGEPVKLAVAAK